MVHFITRELDCPAAPLRKERVELAYAFTPEGQVVFRPFNGCESLNGSDVCTACLTKVNKFILRGDVTVEAVLDELF